MVEDVEEFSPKFQPESFPQLKSFVGRKVKVHQVGAAQRRTSGIPEDAGKALAATVARDRRERRSNKRGLIEPAVQSLVPGFAATKALLRCYVKGEVIGVVDLVWPRRKRAGVGEIPSHQDIKGLPAPRSSDPGHLPSSQNRLRHAARRTAKMFPFAVRQLVDVTHR